MYSYPTPHKKASFLGGLMERERNKVQAYPVRDGVIDAGLPV